MATIVKTPSGTWKAVIRKQGWPTAAKTFRTKRDAEDWSRRTEDEMVRGVFIQRAPSERLTFNNALDRYLKEVSASKKASTHKAETKKGVPLRAFFGKYSLAAINADLVARYRDQRLAQGMSANTVRLDLALLSHLFTIAIKEWRIGLIQNPVSNIRKPSAGEGRDRRLGGDEEKHLRAAVTAHSNPMLQWIFELAIETGMRVGEITGLRRPQIDITAGFITLTDTKNGSSRKVPLSDVAIAVMRKALANPVRPIDTDLVFFGEPGRDGKRRPYCFDRPWQEIKRKVGVQNLRFHDLRHEAISRWAEDGATTLQIAAISGHKSMQVLKRYSHPSRESLLEVVNRTGREKRLPSRRRLSGR